MGMKAYSYVVVGIKTTRQQCEADNIDLYEQFEENEQGINAVYGEGTDDVLIGKVVFEHDPYDDTDHAVELELPDMAVIVENLVTAGVANASLDSVKLYAITVWL